MLTLPADTSNGISANGLGDESEKCQRVSAPYPVQVLPPILRAMVEQGAVAQGVDPALFAVPLLPILAGSIGATRVVRVKRQYAEPCVIWSAIVGCSGTGKSPPMDLLLEPLREQDGIHAAEQQRQVADYELAKDEWERDRRRQKDHKHAPSRPRPLPPPIKTCTTNDVTMEALILRLVDNPRGILMAVDELSGWVGSFDSYRAGGKSDEPKWLSIHGARPIRVDRKAGDRPVLRVPRAAVSVMGSIQPGVARRSLGRQQRESGLAGRILMAQPPVKVALWNENEIDQQVVTDYAKVISSLLALPFEQRPSGQGPGELTLTGDARLVWIEYHNKVEKLGKEAAANQDNDLSSTYAKLKGGALRIALAIALAYAAEDGADACRAETMVDLPSMVAGIAIAEWFIEEQKRIYQDLSIEEGEPESLLDLILERSAGKTDVRTLMRTTRRYKTAASARSALDDLSRQGAGEWQTIKAPNGRKTSNWLAFQQEEGPS